MAVKTVSQKDRKTTKKSETPKAGTEKKTQTPKGKAPAKKAPVKKKAATKKTAETSTRKSNSRRAKSKRKNNLYRLCSEMNKLCIDAVDKEVVKRFKILIDTSAEEITKTSLSAILSNPTEMDSSIFHESIQPYVKHYIFMYKRSKK